MKIRNKNQKLKDLPGILYIAKNGQDFIQQIGRDRNGFPELMVTFNMGWGSDYPIRYDDGKIAFDNPFIITKEIKNKCRKLLSVLEI